MMTVETCNFVEMESYRFLVESAERSEILTSRSQTLDFMTWFFSFYNTC